MNYLELTETLSQSFADLVRRLINFLPDLLSALAFLVVGWVLARVLRTFVSRVIVAVQDRLARNAAIQRSLERTGLRQTIPKVLSAVAFWAVLLFFISAAIERLGLDVVTSLLGQFTAYLPSVLLGVLVFFVGLVAANLARYAVASATASAGMAYGDVLGRAVQVSIVAVAVVVGADQVGIDSTFLTLTVAIVAGTTLGGIALAFGLGSGTAVSNIIAAYYVQKGYRPGQRVRIGDVQGSIREISLTEVVLETDSGEVHVPAKKFSEETCVLLGEQPS